MAFIADALDQVFFGGQGEELVEDAGRSFQERGVFGGLTDVVGRGTQAALGTFGGFAGGVLSEGRDVLSAITGIGPDNRQLTGWERALAGLGLVGAGAIGTAGVVRWAGGSDLFHQWAQAQRRRGAFRGDRGALGFTESSFGVEGVTPISLRGVPEGQQQLASLNRVFQDDGVPDPDILWATVSERTSRLLRGATEDPFVGPTRLAKAVAPDLDDLSAARLGGFISSYGHQLLERVSFHQAGAAGFSSADEAAQAAAAYELARWTHLVDYKLLKGKEAQRAGDLWKRFTEGGQLNDTDLKILMEAMVRTADSLQFVVHPELVFHPLAPISGIDLDDGRAVVSFDVLDFETRGLDTITADELNDRVAKVFQGNPAALIDPMVENIVRFARERVTDGNIQRFLHWYPKARRELEAVAERTGEPRDLLIAIASVLSAAEEWESNVEKAAEVLRMVRNLKHRNLNALAEQVAKAGLRASEQDLVRVILLDAADSPEHFFSSGRTTGGSTLEELGRRWERGEDPRKLLEDRNKSAPHVAQKQPAFDVAIRESTDADLEARRESLYNLMRGLLGDEQVGKGADARFHRVRQPLPVVVDRQAYKVALGFSLIPGNQLSDQKGMFDSMAQAYRIAAAEYGDVLDPVTGQLRQITPEELQAITWMQVRVETGVTDTLFRTLSGKGERAAARDRGFPVRPQGKFEVGVGPDYVFSENILDILLGKVPPPFRTNDAGRQAAPVLGRPEDLNASTSAKNARKTVTAELGEDGSVTIAAPSSLPPERLRGLWLGRARTKDGRRIAHPVRAAWVSDVNEEAKRIDRASIDGQGQQATSGYRIYEPGLADRLRVEHPAFSPGVHLTVNALNDQAKTGYRAERAHALFSAELDRRGIRHEMRLLPAHIGRTRDWGDEPRLGAVFTFETPQDAAEAARLLYSSVDEGVARSSPARMQRAPVDPDGRASIAGRGAEEYIARYGRRYGLRSGGRRVRRDLEVDPELSKARSRAYEELPEVDPAAAPAYRRLAIETRAQFRFMTEELGIKVEFVDDDPYSTPQAMLRDVTKNKRLKVYKTTEDQAHPYLSNDENNMFRAVHDFFGHGGLRTNFSRHGEEVAYFEHARMFSPEAQRALATETLGQNAYLNFSDFNEARRAQGLEAEFPVQKGALFPEEFLERADAYETFERPDGSTVEIRTRRLVDDIYGEERLDDGALYNMVPDVSLYLEDATEAPHGWTRAWETHYFDDNGGYMTNLNVAGDHARSHTVPVWISDDPEMGFAQYVKHGRSLRLKPGSTPRETSTEVTPKGKPKRGNAPQKRQLQYQVLRDGRLTFNGQAIVEAGEGFHLRVSGQGGLLDGARLVERQRWDDYQARHAEWEQKRARGEKAGREPRPPAGGKPKAFAIALPEGAAPEIHMGSADALVARYGPTAVVWVERTGNKWTLKTKAPRGRADLMVAELAEQTIRRLGLKGEMIHQTWK